MPAARTGVGPTAAGTVAPMSTTRTTGRVAAGLRDSPAPLWVLASSVSVQFGAAVAVRLFGQVGPTGAVTLRLVLSALVLLVVFKPRLARPGRVQVDPGDAAVTVGFGVVLATMNLSFYEAIHRIPLGVAVTVEFVGPLAVSIVGSRRWSDALWGVLAGGAVVALAEGPGGHVSAGHDLAASQYLGGSHYLAGVGFAAFAGACWAGYILLSREVGRRYPTGAGLALSLTAASLVALPLGLASAGATLVRPRVLGLGLGVAMLSSAIPYSLEMAVLRRVTPRAFGVLMSLEPAMASLIGWLALGQGLDGWEAVALVAVVAANTGSALSGSGRREPAATGE